MHDTRSMIGLAVLGLLACTGCDSTPVVVLGHAPQTKPRDAGTSPPMAGSGSPIDDFAEHECTENEPVCADDNMTYQNRCLAADAGAHNVRPGPC